MEDLPSHKHCINCGVSIPLEEKFCSPKCEDEWKTLIKKRKKSIMIQMLFIFILIMMMFFVLPM